MSIASLEKDTAKQRSLTPECDPLWMDQLPIKNEDQNASISVDIYGVKVATADSKSAGAEDCAYRSLEAENKRNTRNTNLPDIWWWWWRWWWWGRRWSHFPSPPSNLQQVSTENQKQTLKHHVSHFWETLPEPRSQSKNKTSGAATYAEIQN